MKETKICPCCNVEKNKSEYGVYFSKKRNNYRYQHLCKLCDSNRFKERIKLEYKVNPQKYIEKSKKYRIENIEKVNKIKKKINDKYVKELPDTYIRRLLFWLDGIPNDMAKNNPELIEFKRLQVKINRQLKLLKNGKNKIN